MRSSHYIGARPSFQFGFFCKVLKYKESNKMSEDSVQARLSNEEIPRYDLYIRASLVDNETQGACPMSQQGFMMSYVLAQEKNVDFKVWTVNQVNPPADFKEKNHGKIYPFVEGKSGLDTTGNSIAGVMPESTEKVEEFLESVNTDCPHLKRPKDLKNHILGKIDGIFTQFNLVMKNKKPDSVLTNTLQKVEDHLASTGNVFLDGDMLSYADCFFLPRLHHINIAGKYFFGYEIPKSMKNLWRYMRDAYKTPAFSDTLPFDEDLLKFHFERLPYTEKPALAKRGIKGLFGVDKKNLMKTVSVPDDVAAMLDEANGSECGYTEDADMDHEEMMQQKIE